MIDVLLTQPEPADSLNRNVAIGPSRADSHRRRLACFDLKVFKWYEGEGCVLDLFIQTNGACALLRHDSHRNVRRPLRTLWIGDGQAITSWLRKPRLKQDGLLTFVTI